MCATVLRVVAGLSSPHSVITVPGRSDTTSLTCGCVRCVSFGVGATLRQVGCADLLPRIRSLLYLPPSKLRLLAGASLLWLFSVVPGWTVGGKTEKCCSEEVRGCENVCNYTVLHVHVSSPHSVITVPGRSDRTSLTCGCIRCVSFGVGATLRQVGCADLPPSGVTPDTLPFGRYPRLDP